MYNLKIIDSIENQKLLEQMKQDVFSTFSRFARKQLLKPDFETLIR